MEQSKEGLLESLRVSIQAISTLQSPSASEVRFHIGLLNDALRKGIKFQIFALKESQVSNLTTILTRNPAVAWTEITEVLVQCGVQRADLLNKPKL